MANKIYNFENPSEYVYDSDKINILDGIVSLKTVIPDYYTCGATYTDNINLNWGKGNLTGISVGGASVLTGKLDLAHNDLRYVDYNGDNIISAIQTGCIRFLITPNWSENPTSTAVIFSTFKADNDRKNMIQIQQQTSGDIKIVIYDQNENIIIASNLPSWNPVLGVEYEIEFNWDISIGATRLFIDGVQWGTTNLETGTRDTNIGIIRIGNNPETTLTANFKLNDLIIFNTVQHTSNYTPGYTIPENIYSLDKPTIEPKLSWELSGLSQFTAFVETLEIGNEGSIAYQLSDDDGANWRYWNGSVWAVTSTQYNDVNTIHNNIEAFPITNEKILFKAFLISNGEQQIELDVLEFTALVGSPPIVYAGEDKICKDHNTIKPFLDATISDPDGDIEQAVAYYNIEESGWINIPKGEYGTLQEAVRNFQYIFNNIEVINCQLKIIDQSSKETIDDLNITVQKYIVTFNVKDKDGNHLANLQFLPDDGSDWQLKNSPFTWEYEYYDSDRDIIFDKVGFQTQHIVVEISDHTENVTLNILGAVSPEDVADAVWDELKTNHNIVSSFGKDLQNIKLETDKIYPEIINKKSEYKADLSSIESLVKRCLGLAQENFRVFDTIYAGGHLTSCKIKIYNSANDLENDIDAIGNYQVIVEYNPENTVKNYKVKKI